MGTTQVAMLRSNGAARTGTSQGSMRETKCPGTAGYVTRMSGDVEGGVREAFSSTHCLDSFAVDRNRDVHHHVGM
jgi:hypothetical protein